MITVYDIADMRGPGPKIACAFDSKSLPGKIIVHTLQFDTLEIDSDDFGTMTFPVPHPDNDRRVGLLEGIVRK